MSTEVQELLHRCDDVKSEICRLNYALQQLNWKSFIRKSLQNIKQDIIKLQQKEQQIIESNNELLLQSYESSKQLQTYQSQLVIVDILYLDNQLCIVNKPANICIDGEEHITLEKLTLNTLQNTSKIRHCHQLDRATSGALIYALTKKAAAKVSTLFQNRNVIKIYYTIVYGHVSVNHFVIDFPLSKSPNDPIREMIANDSNVGRAAITECFVKKRGYFRGIKVSLIEVHLHTGRRHQIRLHLSQCGHPIIGDPTYASQHSTLDRMYLDSQRIILNFQNETRVIDVCTNSKYMFDALIETEQGNCRMNMGCNERLLLFPKPHSFDTCNYSMIIPFVVCDGLKDIQILIKKGHKLDMVNYKNDKPRSQVLKGFCWNFVSETRLTKGYSDAAQMISQRLLNEMPCFGKHLLQKSTFAPSEFQINSENESKESHMNAKYAMHHLASNIRRESMHVCTILCSPYVIYMVPFEGTIMNEMEINQNDSMEWCSLSELTDDILCYSPIHIVNIKNKKFAMDPLLHFVLSFCNISSQHWIKQETTERVILNVSKSLWIDRYQMKERQDWKINVMFDNEPIKVLENIDLYLGSIKAAKNIKRLKELNITQIIDCTAKVKQSIVVNGFTKLCIPVKDSVTEDIMQYMNECLEFIGKALRNEESVFVHCHAGASRSVTLIVGYLMKCNDMNLKKSLELIAKRRGGFARPNTKFLLQLIEMERELFGCNSFHLTVKQMERYNRKNQKHSKAK